MYAMAVLKKNSSALCCSFVAALMVVMATTLQLSSCDAHKEPDPLSSLPPPLFFAAASRSTHRPPPHRAMEHEDETSEDYSSLLCITSQDGDEYEIPATIEDMDYNGLELDFMVMCEKHDKELQRFVAFEGINIGRRFLACAEMEAANCGFVE